VAVDFPKKRAPWWSASGTTLASDGTPLAFASGGPPKSRALVCCNGVGVSTFFWDYVGEYHSRDHQVVVWDYRGHGASGVPADVRNLSMAHVADDLARVLDANGIERAVLLGHSMGARIAAAVGALHPDRVRAMLLLDPPMSGPGRAYPTPWESFDEQLQEGIRGTDTEAVRRFYPRWSERELQVRVDWLGTCDPAAIRETYDAFTVDRFETWWGELVRQATLVYGGVSPVVTADDIARLQAMQPQATVACVEGAGHMIPWDEPEASRVLLRSLVAPLSEAAAASHPQGGSR